MINSLESYNSQSDPFKMQDNMLLVQEQMSDWCNKTKPEVDPYIYGNVVHDRVGRWDQWEIKGLTGGKNGYSYKKPMKLNFYHII